MFQRLIGFFHMTWVLDINVNQYQIALLYWWTRGNRGPELINQILHARIREHGVSLEKMGNMENMDKMENMEKNAYFCWYWIENIIRIFVERNIKDSIFPSHTLFTPYKGW